MKSAKKHTFYPTAEVARELKSIPRGQLSERVNDLIMQGLSVEQQKRIAKAYQNYGAALAEEKSQTNSTRFMSAGAFQPEDETEDFI